MSENRPYGDRKLATSQLEGPYQVNIFALLWRLYLFLFTFSFSHVFSLFLSSRSRQPELEGGSSAVRQTEGAAWQRQGGPAVQWQRGPLASRGERRAGAKLRARHVGPATFAPAGGGE